MAEDVEQYLKRVFTSGYMLGKQQGYQQAVDESYPELVDPNEVPKAIGDAIAQYISPEATREDPNGDFSG